MWYNNIGGEQVGNRYTEAQKNASIKYLAEKTDNLQIRLQKGNKERYKLEAAKVGMSLNAFIVQAIENEIIRNNTTEVIK
jgi:predicted HicB family RNase H-like nuclease